MGGGHLLELVCEVTGDPAYSLYGFTDPVSFVWNNKEVVTMHVDLSYRSCIVDRHLFTGYVVSWHHNKFYLNITSLGDTQVGAWQCVLPKQPTLHSNIIDVHTASKQSLHMCVCV